MTRSRSIGNFLSFLTAAVVVAVVVAVVAAVVAAAAG